MSGAVSHPGGDEEHVPPRIRVVVNDRMQRRLRVPSNRCRSAGTSPPPAGVPICRSLALGGGIRRGREQAVAIETRIDSAAGHRAAASAPTCTNEPSRSAGTSPPPAGVPICRSLALRGWHSPREGAGSGNRDADRQRRWSSIMPYLAEELRAGGCAVTRGIARGRGLQQRRERSLPGTLTPPRTGHDSGNGSTPMSQCRRLVHRDRAERNRREETGCRCLVRRRPSTPAPVGSRCRRRAAGSPRRSPRTAPSRRRGRGSAWRRLRPRRAVGKRGRGARNGDPTRFTRRRGPRAPLRSHGLPPRSILPPPGRPAVAWTEPRVGESVLAVPLQAWASCALLSDSSRAIITSVSRRSHVFEHRQGGRVREATAGPARA